MLKIVTIAARVACGAMLGGCAADVAPQGAIDDGPALAASLAETAPQTFEMQLRSDTTAETILPQIVQAGHAQLIEACENNPGASVRVYNPLASGAYADLQCTAILGGEKTLGESWQTLTSEPVEG
jgi:hypothetical protein